MGPITFHGLESSPTTATTTPTVESTLSAPKPHRSGQQVNICKLSGSLGPQLQVVGTAGEGARILGRSSRVFLDMLLS